MNSSHLNRIISLGLLVFSLTSLKAVAISDPCNLMQKETPANVTMSSSELRLYSQKLQRECELTNRFRNVRSKLENKYGVSIEKLTEYQAMRYVRRVNYEESRAMNIPIEKTYQINDSLYKLPIEQRSSIIWDNWIKGLTQLPQSREKILRGEMFTLEDLKSVHMGFFLLSREISAEGQRQGDNAHVPDEGKIKIAYDNDNFWWPFRNQQEADAGRATVAEINQFYKTLGLVKSSAEPYMDVLRIKTIKEFKSYLYEIASSTYEARKAQLMDQIHEITLNDEVTVIFSGDSRANPTHLKNILNFVNTMFDQALQDQPMVWNGRMMTPGEVSYLAQKFYVGVHPFSEGNGRTSRFIQELFLTTFDMPHGSSGDLMDIDVLTSFDDYYQRAIESNIGLIGHVEDCIQQYDSNWARSREKIMSKASMLDYGCRLLN